ncbi:hypothetical protein [Streptomyces sp. NPDC090994]|uniref:hypothetical protein n=1 Tax=Streptomyces sp. NPDC090994 TaxID=3365969 RepID=UPI003813FEC6
MRETRVAQKARETDAGPEEKGRSSAVPVAPDDASAGPGEAGLAPPETPVRRPAPRPVAHTEDGSGPAPRILPLGSGLVLVGLGLALAFVGLRLRRT